MQRDAKTKWHLSRPMEVSGFNEMELAQQNRTIGELIREIIELSDQQIEQILIHQRQHRTRFGESAIALKLASREDVLQALARQFDYTYTPGRTGSDAYRELVAASNPFSEGAEAIRELRSQLLMGVLAEDPATSRKALAVISQDVGDGKTYIAANLAVSLSQLGGRTLLLDADMRTPRVHEVCGISSSAGLSGILSGRADRNVVLQIKAIPGLFVLPVGGIPPNPLELVQRPIFGLLLHELLKKFDHVVVDTPAAVHGADARVIASKAGAALIVGRRNHSKTVSVENLARKIAKGPTVLAGLVINDR